MPFSMYYAMEHSKHLQKKNNNMELINYIWFKHSILIDKCCLMEYSIIKERNLHYGVLRRIDDFKNSIGFDKSCLMEYSMSIGKKMLNGVLEKCDIWRTPYPQENLTLWSTPCQCNSFALWSPSKISSPRNCMPFCKFYHMEYSICMQKIWHMEYSR